jgi:hypothetical protein
MDIQQTRISIRLPEERMSSDLRHFS